MSFTHDELSQVMNKSGIEHSTSVHALTASGLAEEEHPSGAPQHAGMALSASAAGDSQGAYQAHMKAADAHQRAAEKYSGTASRLHRAASNMHGRAASLHKAAMVSGKTIEQEVGPPPSVITGAESSIMDYANTDTWDETAPSPSPMLQAGNWRDNIRNKDVDEDDDDEEEHRRHTHNTHTRNANSGNYGVPIPPTQEELLNNTFNHLSAPGEVLLDLSQQPIYSGPESLTVNAAGEMVGLRQTGTRAPVPPTMSGYGSSMSDINWGHDALTANVDMSRAGPRLMGSAEEMGVPTMNFAQIAEEQRLAEQRKGVQQGSNEHSFDDTLGQISSGSYGMDDQYNGQPMRHLTPEDIVAEQRRIDQLTQENRRRQGLMIDPKGNVVPMPDDMPMGGIINTLAEERRLEMMQVQNEKHRNADRRRNWRG